MAKKLILMTIASCLVFGLRTLRANPTDPAINSVVVNYTLNNLTISGVNLLGSDSAGVYSVTLHGAPAGNTILMVQPSSTADKIVANFPAASPASSFAPGDYFLDVVFLEKTG